MKFQKLIYGMTSLLLHLKTTAFSLGESREALLRLLKDAERLEIVLKHDCAHILLLEEVKDAVLSQSELVTDAATSFQVLIAAVLHSDVKDTGSQIVNRVRNLPEGAVSTWL